MINAHKAAGIDVGGKKGFNKNGNIKVGWQTDIQLTEFYKTCVEVALRLGSWKEVSLLPASRGFKRPDPTTPSVGYMGQLHVPCKQALGTFLDECQDVMPRTLFSSVPLSIAAYFARS